MGKECFICFNYTYDNTPPIPNIFQCEYPDLHQSPYRELFNLMIDGDKKVVSEQPFASFPKVNSLQS